MSGFAQPVQGTVKITGGTIDGVTIGGTTPAISVWSNQYIGTGNKNYTGSTTNQFLNIAYAATGSNSTSSVLQENGIAVNDEVAAPNATLLGFQVANGIGGGGTGLRTALFGHQFTTTFASVGPGPMYGSQAFYCGVEGRAEGNVSLGGSTASSTYQGTNGAALSTLSTLTLNSTAGWPAQGGGTIVTSGGTHQFSYTAVSGATLTGCLYDGNQAHTVATNAAVNGSAIGSYWGGLFYGAIQGGTNHQQVYGAEIDVSVASGSGPLIKGGLLIVQTASDHDRGTVTDIALNIANQLSAGTTWQNGIIFGQTGKGWPFASDSTIIGVQNAGNASVGINFTGVTFAGNQYQGPGFAVAGAGPGAFAAGDKYLIIDASGNVHKSALGPAS